MNTRLRTIALLLGMSFAGVTAHASEPLRSGDLIGTWCDMQLPNNPEVDYVIEIWRDNGGRYSYHQLIRSTGKTEVSTNSYWAAQRDGKWFIENGHDEYARKDSRGSLNIYDAFGLITTAKAVRANTKPSQCRQSLGGK